MLSQTQCKAFYFAACPFVMAFWLSGKVLWMFFCFIVFCIFAL